MPKALFQKPLSVSAMARKGRKTQAGANFKCFEKVTGIGIGQEGWKVESVGGQIVFKQNFFFQKYRERGLPILGCSFSFCRRVY